MYFLHKNVSIKILLISLCLIQTVLAIEDLYCVDQNCYDLLGVGRDATKSEIGKAYRKLAGKYHPDRFINQPDLKEEAEAKFMLIATAYEVLKDDDSREEYNYMLDHPEEMWLNRYRYYRRQITPKVDVRIVIVITLTIISAIQYYSAWSNYDDAIKYLATVPKYRNQAIQIAKDDGLLKQDKKSNKRKTKEQIKEEEERVLRQIIENKMDIRGGYAKPKISSILWIQIILLPVTIFNWIYFYGRWLWKFSIMKEEYGREEKLYVIKSFMKLSQTQFDAMTEEEKDEFLEDELWILEKFLVWKAAKEHEIRVKMAQSGRFKQYRRYMKNHDNRMTFDDS